MNVLVGTAVVGRRRTVCAVALLHGEGEGLGLDGAVGIGLGVVVGEFYRWNGVLALVARNSEEVVNHVALHTVLGELGLVGDFGVILVEVFRQVEHRLLEEFQVSDASHYHTDVDGIASLHVVLVERGRDIEAAYSTREVGRTCRQRVHLNGNARRLDRLMHLDITRAAIEESLDGVDIAVLPNHDTLEGDAWNLHFSCHLRIHHILTPSNSTIWFTINSFDMETLLLWQRYFLSMETCELRHLTFELCQVNESINLICEQDRLLFIHLPLIGANLYKQVSTRDCTSCNLHMWRIVVIFVHLW